jgi:release factor glutamine methyltransferase
VRLLSLPGVFQPHSDSWLLADSLRHEHLDADTALLDLCTGSGLLAVHAARRYRCRVTAADLSRRAVASARLNAALNGVRVRALRGDLFDPVGGEQFDVIVSNPPYVPNPSGQAGGRGVARAWEAGFDGRAFLDRICAAAPSHLRRGGVLLLVQSAVCGIDATLKALTARSLRTSLVVRHSGPLGPLLQARADWLRGSGLLGADDLEEIVVIRAERA